MKKKAGRSALIIFLAVLFLLAALCAIYFLFFSRFVLVSDPAWTYLLPKSELFSLRLELAKAGKRLVVVDATASDLSSTSSLNPMFLNLNAKELLLSPLVSQAVVAFDLNVSALLENTVVYGLWSHSCSLFDVTVISDVNTGWTQAALALVQQWSDSQTVAQNLAVVYDSKGSSALQAIESVISSRNLIPYFYDGTSQLYYSNTAKDMNEKQVVLALCPHLENLYELVSQDCSISWIVDYRYEKLVPKIQLYGVVLPNLSGLFKTISGSSATETAQKGSGQTYTLEYKYETR
jgi:hypothetical protein